MRLIVQELHQTNQQLDHSQQLGILVLLHLYLLQQLSLNLSFQLNVGLHQKSHTQYKGLVQLLCQFVQLANHLEHNQSQQQREKLQQPHLIYLQVSQ